MGVPPVIIHFHGIFHDRNHPAMGYPNGKPHRCANKRGHRFPAASMPFTASWPTTGLACWKDRGDRWGDFLGKWRLEACSFGPSQL